MTNTTLIYDIKFYQVDEEGNEILDREGNTKIFKLKESTLPKFDVRHDILEYLSNYFENLENRYNFNILEEAKENDN
mgnify:CR=1 FL=1|tara:strand:- start:196 stop:426 length:231 start_codon:yes stop_codon:yes gene_type:complete